MRNDEGLYNDKLVAFIPCYDDKLGNATKLIYEEKEVLVGKTVKTVVKNLCMHYQFDLKASNKYYSEILTSKSAIPIPISTALIYVQLKVREPIGKDDGAMGYFKLNYVDKIYSTNGDTYIRLKNKAEFKLLCSLNTGTKQLKNGELVEKLHKEVEKDKVKDALVYYQNEDSPAMKSDIARLFMKIDDILERIK